MKQFLLLTCLSTFCSMEAVDHEKIAVTATPQDALSQKITVTIPLEKDELLYKQSIQVTSSNPALVISEPHMQDKSVATYDPTLKKTIDAYQNNLTFTVNAQLQSKASHKTGTLHIFFSTNRDKKTQEKLIPVSFENNHVNNSQNTVQATSSEAQPYTVMHTAENHDSDPSGAPSIFERIVNRIHTLAQRWKTTLSSLFETTGSRGLRLLVAFILGVLLSLTPCIYPMIPITVGILQTSQNKSMLRNFAVALAYTLGISCTFAVFGFITALGSHIFGELQNTGWIVLPLIALLIYLGLSMFGLYDMYVPKFMQPKTGTVKGGSFISAFIFGAISGTIASPCLSPGLALVLTHVAKITQHGNILSYLDGFLMLFMFGIGSSLPLLIIGTFSTSLQLLPKAGLWMVEVKRILGLMLLLMAFYQLEKFIPWFILSWFMVLFLLAVGIYYFIDIKSYDSNGIRRYKHIMGVLLIISACLMSTKAYKAYYIHMHPEQNKQSMWLTDYEAARAQAQKENKKLLLDFTTENCALCKVLEKRFQETPEIAEALKSFVLVQIDGSHTTTEPFMHLQKLLEIRGFPTVAILEPGNETVLKKWAGDIGTTEQFALDLKQLA
jgi:thioredoxin:protein disulfide reductase